MREASEHDRLVRGGVGLNGFQGAIRKLVRRTQSADLRNFRTLTAEQSWQTTVARVSVPIVLGIIQDARGLVNEIIEMAERLASESDEQRETLPDSLLPFEHAIDRVVDRGSNTYQAVANLAFLVQMEIRERGERMRRLGDRTSPSTTIIECDSALRRVRKGMSAIDIALSRAEGVDPVVDFTSELQESLTVRRAYSRLRSRIKTHEEPTAATLAPRLRMVFAQVGLLLDDQVEWLLRIKDRLQFLEMQSRLAAWLGATPDIVSGMHLWQDVAGFVQMLAQINRRQELVEHDANVLRAVVRALPENTTDMTDVMVGRIDVLRGMSDELDALLIAQPRRVGNEWRETLISLLQRAEGTGEGVRS